VDEQLHPQLRDLVLDDEEEFVVVRRIGQRLLRRQEAVQLEVAAVGHPAFEVGVDALLEGALVVFDAHGGKGNAGRVSSGLPVA
jgi:hypothetical protein